MGFGQYQYKDELRKALAFHNMPVTLALFLGALLSTPFLSIPPQHSIFACSIFVTRCAKKRIPEVHAIEVFPSPAFLQTFVPLGATQQHAVFRDVQKLLADTNLLGDLSFMSGFRPLMPHAQEIDLKVGTSPSTGPILAIVFFATGAANRCLS